VEIKWLRQLIVGEFEKYDQDMFYISWKDSYLFESRTLRMEKIYNTFIEEYQQLSKTCGGTYCRTKQ